MTQRRWARVQLRVFDASGAKRPALLCTTRSDLIGADLRREAVTPRS
ncbi:hypothetical protein ACWEOE_13145 [Amycolatopsis sp. NPDC004368]